MSDGATRAERRWIEMMQARADCLLTARAVVDCCEWVGCRFELVMARWLRTRDGGLLSLEWHGWFTGARVAMKVAMVIESTHGVEAEKAMVLLWIGYG
ncbi:hypothetical protein M0R45_035912 [Rubus argutus]|uniref:PH domain-containing protein n=1 Tax=Rubus argutus TaxID=59490 RepID=A0AAW1VYU3_RUBAR